MIGHFILGWLMIDHDGLEQTKIGKDRPGWLMIGQDGAGLIRIGHDWLDRTL